MRGALAALLVGLLWGVTNPFVKRGSGKVDERVKRFASGSPAFSQQLWIWLTTPSFLVPQLLNQSGSILFVYLLGSGGDISTIVPAANACSLLFNALADLALGEPFQLPQLGLGTLLVAFGVYLCGTSA